MKRREFVGLLPAAALGSTGVERYETPYKYGRLVLAADARPGAFDSKAVDCPFVFHHNGAYHMTYLGFDGTGYQTGLARSRDLVNWERLGCILKRDESNPITRYNVAMNWILRDSKFDSKGPLKKVKGRYVGVFHAYPNAGYEAGPAVIGLCSSKDLMSWELGDICLKPGDGAEWESGGLYKPCLVEEGGTYYLFYNAKGQTRTKAQGGGWREQTGVATSTDLKTWKRYEGSPIVRNGGAGSVDERFASDPCVVRDGKRWVLFYFGLDGKGVARELVAWGDDPYRLTKSEKVLVDVGPPGSVDEKYAHKPSVVVDGGVVYHFYCAVSGKWPNDVRGITVARSRRWR